MDRKDYTKKLIQCLKDTINDEIIDKDYYRLALALAFLSLRRNNTVFSDADYEISSNIKNIITNISNGNFKIYGRCFVIEDNNSLKTLPFDGFYKYIENHITPRVNRYRTPLLGFYNNSIGHKKITTEDALNNTIFYQVNISGDSIPVYKIENDIENLMSELNSSINEVDYLKKYYLACHELEKRLKEKYPNCQVYIHTTSYAGLNKKNKKSIKPSKTRYNSYDEFYTALCSKNNKSLLNVIGNLYYDLDNLPDKDQLIHIFGLAIFLLNSNLKVEDFEEVCRITKNIDGYSLDAFKKFASNRLDSCSGCIDGFIRNKMANMDRKSLENYAHNKNFDCINYRSMLSANSVKSPTISNECFTKLLNKRQNSLIALIEWQNKLFEDHTEEEYIIIKKVILAYLQRISDIEEAFLYFRCDPIETIDLIKEGLSHNDGINVGSDNHLAFSKVDSSNKLQGFAGCSLDTFIELLSFGLGEDEYYNPFQYKK